MASRLEAYLRQVIAHCSPRRGLLPSTLRTILAGLAGLYGAGLAVYLAAEQIGLRRRIVLPLPVVSIGNLSVGGTGKTPMTQWLCRHLVAQGKRVAILSRGHGGDSQTPRLVSDEDGNITLTAAQAGDEPIFLAHTLPGIPVLVGKDRRLTGREALRRFGLEALVLDDGFQFWQLARTLDIVLLDARVPFDNGYALPRGLLREPKHHLRRAAIVIVTRADSLALEERAALTQQIVRLAPRSEIYFARHVPTCLVPVADPSQPILSLNTLHSLPIVALSGIARPESFVHLLTDQCGARIVRHLVYPDHQEYGASDVRAAEYAAQESNAAMLVMTEKDAVKWSLRQAVVPIYALRIEMQIEEEEKLLSSIWPRLFPGTDNISDAKDGLKVRECP